MQATYAKRNGHERYRFFRKDNGSRAEARRKSSLQRLDIQLVSNTKPNGEGQLISLEEKDKERIKREIASLKIKLSIS